MHRKKPENPHILGTNETTAPGVNTRRREEITRPAIAQTQESTHPSYIPPKEHIQIGDKIKLKRSSGEWQECEVFDIHEGQVGLHNKATSKPFYFNEIQFEQLQQAERVYDLIASRQKLCIKINEKFYPCTADSDTIDTHVLVFYKDQNIGLRKVEIELEEFLKWQKEYEEQST